MQNMCSIDMPDISFQIANCILRNLTDIPDCFNVFVLIHYHIFAIQVFLFLNQNHFCIIKP